MLLEKEDWPALIRYLEERVIQKGHYSLRLVRLLANSYLVLSDSAAVISLENKVALAKPALLNSLALVFGTARILGNDYSGAVHFFESRKETVKAGIKDWVQWYYGFALLLNREIEKSASEFTHLARFSKDNITTALASYFLCKNLAEMIPAKATKLEEDSKTGRERVFGALPKVSDWKHEISKHSGGIHAAALAKYLDETGHWLYH